LNLENLTRTEADIIFFKDQLEKCTKGTDEYKKTTEVIMHLNDRRANLDKLKNIDSKISLLIKTRTEFSEEQIHYQDNLSPEEIRKKIVNYTKGKELALTEKESMILEKIKKPLEEYEKVLASISSEGKKQTMFDPKQAPLMIKKMALNSAWKKYRKIIRKEELLEDEGTIHQLDELETKRETIVERLNELEEITEDDNEEMIINYEKYLDPETRTIISKNEIDELNRLDDINKKFNRFAFTSIGVIVVGGLSYIISVLSI